MPLFVQRNDPRVELNEITPYLQHIGKYPTGRFVIRLWVGLKGWEQVLQNAFDTTNSSWSALDPMAPARWEENVALGRIDVQLDVYGECPFSLKVLF